MVTELKFPSGRLNTTRAHKTTSMVMLEAHYPLTKLFSSSPTDRNYELAESGAVKATSKLLLPL